MLLAQEVALMEIFRAQAAQNRRELEFYLESERTFERHEADERREEEERHGIEQLERASSEQLDAFRSRLDRYDTAVVDALMDNEQALGKARQHREEIEAKAYRLPDGRMAFKTEDGQRVVDQLERDVPRAIADPDSIPNDLPKAGTYRAAVTEENRLLKEREALHAYQHKLDEARETVDKGSVTAKQLDALDADLKASMPDVVKRSAGLQSTGADANGPQNAAPLRASAPPAPGDNPIVRPEISAPRFR